MAHSKHNVSVAEPEWLGRRDVESGQWSIDTCAPERGKPFTSILDRVMHIPVGEDEVARVIRGHELMHAKVSPANFGEWIARGYATERGMRAVEEARVNYLATRAGIPVHLHLEDGTEKPFGLRASETDDWASAVYGCVSMCGTPGLKKFYSGIKKNKPLWVPTLKAIENKVHNAFASHALYGLADTSPVSDEGTLAPMGFLVTERLAAWIDSIAGIDDNKKPEETSDGCEKPGSGGEEEGDGDKPPVSAKEIMKSDPGAADLDDAPLAPGWGDLYPAVAKLDRFIPGSISRKRRASSVGRNPRRIQRLLTDPEKRIFDSKVKGKGGIVLIDASGSMHFEAEDIYQIVCHAPGAIVAMYAEDGVGDPECPNLWVLAKNGKVVSEVPTRMTGNNVDLPALEWALKQRKNRKTPLIWVTDGGVTATDGSYYHELALQCIQLCKREDILIAADGANAVTMMKSLSEGKRPKRTWPWQLRTAYSIRTGKELV